jgi:hypothetical protein
MVTISDRLTLEFLDVRDECVRPPKYIRDAKLTAYIEWKTRKQGWCFEMNYYFAFSNSYLRTIHDHSPISFETLQL